VYASVVSFGVFTSYTTANTRYGWLVRHYPARTFTLQETPSLLGALTVGVSGLWVGRDSLGEQYKPEARKMLEKLHRTHKSIARFVRQAFGKKVSYG